jgi:hypothetical protein
VNDDWRVQVDVAGAGNKMVEYLDALGLEHDLGDAFGETVIVSREGDTVYLYAGSREQAEKAGAAAAAIAAENNWEARSELRRWHPQAERWEDPDAPLPASEAERGAEHAELVEAERAEVAAGATPQWEVRVDLPSHRDAHQLAQTLGAEGIPLVRRWRYLVVGAADEDTARALAARLEAEAPAGTELTVEGNERAVYEERPPNPFAIFGGLGG